METERRRDYPNIIERLVRIEERQISTDKRINGALDCMNKHIDEGDKPGGFRDRILIVEQNIKELKKAEWTRVIVAGVLGGLIGNVSPDLIQGLLSLLGIK